MNSDALTLQDILDRIAQADCIEVTEISKALVNRYSIVAPDGELMFLSLPKNNMEERRRVLTHTWEFLEKHKQI